MTILFYIDEGGTGWSDDETNLFFLASFAIHVQDWSQIDRKFSALKKELLSRKEPEDWELKGRGIWQGQGSFKNFKKEFRFREFKEVSETMSQLLAIYSLFKSTKKDCAKPAKILKMKLVCIA